MGRKWGIMTLCWMGCFGQLAIDHAALAQGRGGRGENAGHHAGQTQNQTNTNNPTGQGMQGANQQGIMPMNQMPR